MLAAIVVFSLGLLALTRLQMSTINTNTLASQMNTATNLAHDQMDTLLSLAYTHADLDDSRADGTSQDGNNDGIDDDDAGTAVDGIAMFGLNQVGALADHTRTYATPLATYTISWNIAVDQPVTGSKVIRVIVQWNDKSNISHTVRVDGTKVSFY